MSTNAIPAPVKSLSWLVPAAAKLARGVRLFATDVIAGVCSLGLRSAVLVCLVTHQPIPAEVAGLLGSVLTWVFTNGKQLVAPFTPSPMIVPTPEKAQLLLEREHGTSDQAA